MTRTPAQPGPARPAEQDFASRFWRTQSVAHGVAATPASPLDDAAFRLLADNIPTLCWIAGGDGYIVWYNRRWHDYCGSTAEQMEGWGWQAVHDPVSLPLVMQRWTAAVQTGEPFEMTFPLRGADGVFRPFLTRIQPLRDGHGRVVRWFGVNTEISAQIAAETALRAERDRSRDVLENMAEGFVLLDHDFTVADINAEGLRLDARPREAVIGRSHWAVWPGSEHSELGTAYKAAMQSRTRVSLDHRYVWPDGRERWLEVRAFPSGRGLAIFYRDITARRQAEARIAESEDHYRHAVELNPQTVWTATPDGQLDRVGHRWFEWTGTTGLGESWGAALHPADLEPTVAAWTASCQTGAPYDIQHRVRMRDGGFRWMHSRAYPRRSPGGAVLRWYGTTQDIEDEKASQAELAASEARFRTVAETMPGFVWTADGAGHLDYTSPNWHDYSGADRAASAGQGWADFLHPDDRARAIDTWQRAVAQATPYECEFRLRRHDGRYRWWLVRARPIAEAGQQTRWVGTGSDLEDIIAARDALARFSADLARLVEDRTAERDRIWRLIPDLLMTGSLDGQIVSVNPAWTASLGYGEAELLAMPFWALIHPDHMAGTADAVQTMREGRTARYQNRIRTAAGAYRWFDWVSTPAGALFYAVARDMTEHKAREADLQLAQEALRQSQKMEAVGQLTGGIAHDFNNMLAVVIGSLELLARRLGSADPRARRHVDAAAEGARRAAMLTQRLLAFSRQQPLQPAPVEVNRLVTGMSDLLRHSLGTAIRLETVLAGGLWRTHVDPNQLESAILNLGVNARDAMGEGGRLTIETQNAHLDERYAAMHLGVPAGQYVLIAVTDTGTGMPPEVVAKAFDPFFTTKAVGKGTGLGLSQVYGFVKQSGGHVKIYSEPAQGTTMKIYLPRMLNGDDTEAADANAATVPLGDHGELIMVVEDEPAVRQLSVDALRELGYRTVEADCAAAAMRLIDAHPDIALMFTDIVMPDVNGAKLAEAARRRRPDLKILFTTGYTRNAVVHNGVVDPGVDLLGKPFTLEQLAAKVRQSLDATRP